MADSHAFELCKVEAPVDYREPGAHREKRGLVSKHPRVALYLFYLSWAGVFAWVRMWPSVETSHVRSITVRWVALMVFVGGDAFVRHVKYRELASQVTKIIAKHTFAALMAITQEIRIAHAQTMRGRL